eukprot:3955853-Pleurochrysis_carterae.AAC.1
MDVAAKLMALSAAPNISLKSASSSCVASAVSASSGSGAPRSTGKPGAAALRTRASSFERMAL